MPKHFDIFIVINSIILTINKYSELERGRIRENKGAITIQRNIKMYLCRKRYKLLKTNSLEIQRNFKGFLAKNDHAKKVIELSTEMNFEFFNCQATIIKKQ